MSSATLAFTPALPHFGSLKACQLPAINESGVFRRGAASTAFSTHLGPGLSCFAAAVSPCMQSGPVAVKRGGRGPPRRQSRSPHRGNCRAAVAIPSADAVASVLTAIRSGIMPVFAVAPNRDQKPSRPRHNGDPARAPLQRPDALAEPRGERTAKLVVQLQPEAPCSGGLEATQ
jgi:hypothetical protein